MMGLFYKKIVGNDPFTFSHNSFVKFQVKKNGSHNMLKSSGAVVGRSCVNIYGDYRLLVVLLGFM